MKTEIAFFDFDGTITTKDTMMMFIRYVVGDLSFLKGLILLSPMLLLYKMKLIPNYRAKESFLSYFLKGMDSNDLNKLGDIFSEDKIDKIIRKGALERLQWHKTHGHEIVVVSASVNVWIKKWCENAELKLISTELEIVNNTVTGRLATKNCYGIEKTNRIKTKYDLSKYHKIYSYGDSRGDKEMLSIAHEKSYKPFR